MIKIPTVQGVIDRRILINFRVDPDILAAQCPAPFRPQLVDGYGVAGICLIRLKSIRPLGFPGFAGLSSENAAHRIAVEWEDAGHLKTGVYIPRRDTSSWFNALIGGRVFPGVHHLANFEVDETETQMSIRVASRDRGVYLAARGRVAGDLPEQSIFPTLESSSQFFKAGSLGYSPSGQEAHFDGLELRSLGWKVEPFAVESVESSFFQDGSRFPIGTATLDHALLMRGIDHQWHGRATIDCCT